jgi:ligand-binding sensor domain-containing protein/signal transduction histidine kinase
LTIWVLAATAWSLSGTGVGLASLSARGPGISRTPLKPQVTSLPGEALDVRSTERGAQTRQSEVPSTQTSPIDQAEFEQISVADGLSQSSVNCILQDSRGFMWFGTNDGLNRYDGYDFVVYQSDPDGEDGLSHDTVTSLIEDAAGGLWIGTLGGLDHLDLETGRFTHYGPDGENPQSLMDDEVLALYEDSGQTLWVGTSGGLDRFDRETAQFVHYRADGDDRGSLPDNRILSIYEDRAGVLWIGTWRGLARRNPESDGFTRYQLAPEDVTELGHNAVQAIIEDSGGTLWVGTGGSGFYRFDRQTEAFTQLLVDPHDVGGFAQNDVRALREDQTGMLWLGTDGGGLYQFDRHENRLVPHRKNPQDSGSLSSNYVNTIYESRRGVLWIGTSGGGISKLDQDKHRFLLYQADPSDPDSLSHNRVLALYEDDEGSLWVGTDGGGLDRFDRASGTFTHFTHNPDDRTSLSNNCVTAIQQGQDGYLWIGTWGGGMARFDREKGQFVRYQADPFDPRSLSSNRVYTIFEDHEGIMWVGTDVALQRFDPTAGRFVSYFGSGGEILAIHEDSTDDREVRDIYEDPDHDLWFATDAGLAMLDREDGRVLRYVADPERSSGRHQNEVNTVHRDLAGALWIGTRGGLSRFDPGAAVFKHYGEEDGLADDVVQAILEDDQGHLWISTTGGLSRFDPESRVFRNYDAGDGLHGHEFTRASCRSSDGTMFLGSINGLNAFAPDRVKDNPYPPPVMLTSLTQSGREVDGGRAVEGMKEVEITWPDNSLEFGFAALNYHQPEKNRYAYRLEGFDRDWNVVGTRRFGRYTNLPGGTYTLRIRASNNDGIWNEEGIALKVRVVPPVWATWWFRGAVLVVLVVGSAAGYRLRVRGIEARSRELDELVGDRTAALSRTNELLMQEIAERKRAEEALAQRAAEAAVAAERSRLARDLHDAVTQLLFSASLIAEALPGIWESDQDEGRELLGELRRLSRGALAEMRTLLLELRPASLTETSLVELLHQLAEAATGRTELSIEVRADGVPALPRDTHIALYRIAQEALNNVIKHARASRATISLCCLPSEDPGDGQQQVTLAVSDDGCGFDPGRVRPDHMGLGIIRERAERIGAELGVESQPGRGTEVMVRWRGPLQ